MLQVSRFSRFAGPLGFIPAARPDPVRVAKMMIEICIFGLLLIGVSDDGMGKIRCWTEWKAEEGYGRGKGFYT